MFTRTLLALTLIAIGSSAWADDTDTSWMALMLEGHKTGWLKSVRTVADDRVIHEETVHIEIQRTGVPIEMTTFDRSVETIDGRPLAFRSTQDIAGGSMEIVGTIAPDGTTTVTTTSAGNVQTQTVRWPEGALLPEGLRLATEAAGLEPGTRFETIAYIASSLQAAPVTMEVLGTETVDLFGVELELTRTTQTMAIGQTETRMVTWVDEELRPKKMQFSIMGLTMETIACPEECALADTQPAEFFTQAFAHAPTALSADSLDGSLVYTIRPRADADIHFPSGSEQQAIVADDGTLTVIVVAGDDARSPAGVIDASPYLGQTRWLQSGAPEVISLVADAGGAAASARESMQRFERFVRRYVSDKNLSVGYATALETARSRSGDCTEHALLLAAMGRAAGIPTRIATGLAYVDDWLGSQDVFVPHAWTQALIDGRWTSFDAALYGFDAGHLALSYGDGDPWNFYDGVNTLGNFDILAIEPQVVAEAAP